MKIKVDARADKQVIDDIKLLAKSQFRSFSAEVDVAITKHRDENMDKINVLRKKKK